MVPADETFVRRYKWHIVIICATLAIVVLLALFTSIFEASEARVLRDLVWLLGALIFISALLALVSRVFKIVGALRENSAKLEEVTGTLEKIRDGLAQINQSTRISDAAKAIAFRDADRQSLREAVFEKLQRHEFDSAYELIDEIAKHAEYKELAQQLRLQTDRYHDATNQERLDQGIAHIEQLLDNHEWVKASTQIEDLIRSHPDTEKARAMRQRLLERKEQRKKELLAVWDEAVKRQETDRSLEILKELDLYLTPNEGLALQEAAKDVFRTKLHNLGVQFSMAVTERQWEQAIQAGEQIMRDFPNSKMADEIREKMEVLRQKVQ
jgi:hypothetical protein